MTELVHAAFSGVNVVYTMLLLFMLLYWCIVMLGLIDVGEMGLDLDVDADVDVDADLDGAAGGSFSWLAFFNVGEVPLMLYASMVLLAMWVVSMQFNHWLDLNATGWMRDHRGWIAVGMAVPNLLFGMFLAKLLLIPVKRMRNKKQQRKSLAGRVCLVTSLQVDEKFGRCEMPKDESSLLLDVRTRDGEVLQKGDPAEIVERVVEGDHEHYIVTKKVWDEEP